MKPKNEDAEVIEVDVGGEKKKIVMAPGKNIPGTGSYRFYERPGLRDPDPTLRFPENCHKLPVHWCRNSFFFTSFNVMVIDFLS